MRWPFLLVTLALLGVGLGVGIVSANTPPLADAGLDQQVERNTTVYLDAGGSVDPDGSIDHYRWEITAPNGTTINPDCPTCRDTRFRPNRTGQYNVTVTVTDSEGATRQDTLFVTVDPVNPPSVELTGSQTVVEGQTHNYTASATAGDADLSALVWRINGTHQTNTPIAGTSETVTEGHSFERGNPTLSATVIDRDGARHTDTLDITVVPGPTGTGAGGGGGGGNIAGIWQSGNEFIILDSNGDGKLTGLEVPEFDGNNDKVILSNKEMDHIKDRGQITEGDAIGEQYISIKTGTKYGKSLDKQTGTGTTVGGQIEIETEKKNNPGGDHGNSDGVGSHGVAAGGSDADRLFDGTANLGGSTGGSNNGDSNNGNDSGGSNSYAGGTHSSGGSTWGGWGL